MSRATRIAGLLAALALVVPVFGCGPDPASSGGASGGSPAAAGQADAAGGVAAGKSIALGEKGTVGPYTLTVSAADRPAEIKDPSGKYEARKAAAGKELLVLTLDFGNGTDKPNGVGPAYLRLKDSGGVEYPAFETSSKEFIFNMPGPVPAKGTASTRIAFEIPKGTKGFTLTWTPFVEGAQQSSAVFGFE
jgi:hypothetical protein